MSSLEHLIELAKKTGDRLIVHDPFEGNDVIIMDVDSYENLISENDNDVRNLSETQLLNQINRDIAVWRANKELGSDYFDDDIPDVEDEMDDEFDNSNWHSTEKILKEKFGKEPAPIFESALPPISGEEIKSNFPKLDALGKDEDLLVNDNGVLTSVDEPVFYEEPV